MIVRNTPGRTFTAKGVVRQGEELRVDLPPEIVASHGFAEVTVAPEEVPEPPKVPVTQPQTGPKKPPKSPSPPPSPKGASGSVPTTPSPTPVVESKEEGPTPEGSPS